MNEFRYTTYAQEVIFGVGALNKLGEAAERFGWQRLMLCTSPSLGSGGYVAGVEAILGERLVAIYDQVQSHVLDFQLAEALALATQAQVEAVIGLGGGSSIGIAKAVSSVLEEQQTGRPA